MFKKAFRAVESRFFEPLRKVDKKFEIEKSMVTSNHSLKIKYQVGS